MTFVLEHQPPIIWPNFRIKTEVACGLVGYRKAASWLKFRVCKRGHDIRVKRAGTFSQICIDQNRFIEVRYHKDGRDVTFSCPWPFSAIHFLASHRHCRHPGCDHRCATMRTAPWAFWSFWSFFLPCWGSKCQGFRTDFCQDPESQCQILGPVL